MKQSDDDRRPLSAVQTKPHWVDPESWLALEKAQRAMDEVPIGDATALIDAFVTHACHGTNAAFGVAIVVKRLPHLDPASDPLMGMRIVEVLGRAVDAARLAPHVAFLGDERNYINDPTTPRMSRLAGSNRVYRMREMCADDTEAQAAIMTYLKATGVGDRLVAGFGLSPDCDLMILLDRPLGAPPFEDRALSWMVAFAGGSVRLARAAARGLGHLDASASLSPRERETLRYLMSPSAEKEIALKLEVSAQTVHVYVKSIYRKFGVSNRAGLLDLWLSPR